MWKNLALRNAAVHFWDRAPLKETRRLPSNMPAVFLPWPISPIPSCWPTRGKDNLHSACGTPSTGSSCLFLQRHPDDEWDRSRSRPTGLPLISGGRDGIIKIWNSLPPEVIDAHKGARPGSQSCSRLTIKS